MSFITVTDEDDGAQVRLNAEIIKVATASPGGGRCRIMVKERSVSHDAGAFANVKRVKETIEQLAAILQEAGVPAITLNVVENDRCKMLVPVGMIYDYRQQDGQRSTINFFDFGSEVVSESPEDIDALIEAATGTPVVKTEVVKKPSLRSGWPGPENADIE